MADDVAPWINLRWPHGLERMSKHGCFFWSVLVEHIVFHWFLIGSNHLPVPSSYIVKLATAPRQNSQDINPCRCKCPWLCVFQLFAILDAFNVHPPSKLEPRTTPPLGAAGKRRHRPPVQLGNKVRAQKPFWMQRCTPAPSECITERF